MVMGGQACALAALITFVGISGASAKMFGLKAPEARGALEVVDESETRVETGRWMNGVLYRMAQREEGLPPVGPPHDKYGGDRYLVKYPRSFIKRIAALRSEGHTRRFNFIGALKDLSVESHYPPGVRDWIPPFVKQHFSDGDYYQDTNPQNQILLGIYDHTFDKRNFTKQQRSYDNDMVPFDETYFRTLCSSEFTLAPAGDLPYSYRFLEAIFCGSIPIVDKEKYANCEHHQYWAKVKLSKKIGWHFHLASKDKNFRYVYNQTWAEENLAKALRYHTFLQGFNDDELCGPGECSL